MSEGNPKNSRKSSESPLFQQTESKDSTSSQEKNEKAVSDSSHVDGVQGDKLNAKTKVSWTKSDTTAVNSNEDKNEASRTLTRSAPELQHDTNSSTSVDYAEIQKLMEKKFERGTGSPPKTKVDAAKEAHDSVKLKSSEKIPAVDEAEKNLVDSSPRRARSRHRSEGSLPHVQEANDVLDSVQEILIEDDKEWKRVVSTRMFPHQVVFLQLAHFVSILAAMPESNFGAICSMLLLETKKNNYESNRLFRSRITVFFRLGPSSGNGTASSCLVSSSSKLWHRTQPTNDTISANHADKHPCSLQERLPSEPERQGSFDQADSCHTMSKPIHIEQGAGSKQRSGGLLGKLELTC